MGLFSTVVLGFTAGLRSMSAPAALAWGDGYGGSPSSGAPLAFLNRGVTPVVLTALALGEIVADKLPIIPDRRSPPAFIGRILSGALSGAAATPESSVVAAIAGGAAAVGGTVIGSALRSRLASVFGRDLPAALIEDALVLLLVAVALSASREPGSARAPQPKVNTAFCASPHAVPGCECFVENHPNRAEISYDIGEPIMR